LRPKEARLSALNRKTGRMWVTPCPAFLLTRRRKPIMPGFTVECQFPRPRIEIIKPDGAVVWLKPDYPGFSPGGKSITSQNLLSYTFQEAVDDLMGGFSFSVENEMVGKSAHDKRGESLFDLIPLRSMVNIYEGERFSPAKVSSDVFPNLWFRWISGFLEFPIRQQKLKLEIFQGVSDEVPQSSRFVNGRLLEIIDKEEYIGKDFVLAAEGETLQYPVAAMFYNQTNNYITDVWGNLLPKPVYGFRLLSVSFAGFDRMQNESKEFLTKEYPEIKKEAKKRGATVY
jgi:hypothetical protein